MKVTIVLTVEELDYIRYIFRVHAGTEDYDTPEEEKQTRKLINKLNDKLGVL